MATVTIVFPWEPGISVPSLRITKVTDNSVTQLSVTCTERSNSPGIYEATFLNPAATDYYLTPRTNGTPVSGVGIVFGVTSTDGAIFYESELVAPGTITLSATDIDDIAAGVVTAIQAIPGFTVEVVSPVDTTGSIEITQGDAYLNTNSRAIQITLTGALPSLETVCKLRIFFGASVVEISGTIVVNSSTNYTLKFDITGTVSAAMPVGAFSYEAEVTYLSTTNKWTPSKGSFTVTPQIG